MGESKRGRLIFLTPCIIHAAIVIDVALWGATAVSRARSRELTIWLPDRAPTRRLVIALD